MILVLNSGSATIKYRLFSTGPAAPDLDPITGGLIEHIGESGGPASHADALRDMAGALRLDAPDLVAVGHRVVHGGSRFVAPTLITPEVVSAIEELTPLAPLHNKPNLAGISVARSLRPDVPQVAVFDTAFHATLPPAAYTYAIPTELARQLSIRRYGFHGTSHAYVSRQTAALLGRPLQTVNTIVLHLGNGASACAVQGGRSVETSMGLTPLEGLVMGTRSGDLDPAVIVALHREGGLALDDIDAVLNRRGGLLGLAGNNDVRAVLAARERGDAAAGLAFDVYCHRIRKYVGAYAAVLGRLDAVTFTAGVGENAAAVRAGALAGLDLLGIAVDPARNAAADRSPRIISPDGAPVAVCVIPTDEELEIATQTRAVTAQHA
ncbi:MAG: acetate kinase [Micromonosporaceae bacterium]|nr:acetate kinase [Micromonosporaceae bacterium]